MQWPKLAELKEKMQVEEEFKDIWSFFFDHLGENQEFMTSGQRADAAMHQYLEPLLEGICQQIVSREVMIIQLLLTAVPEHKFYHGPCVTDAGFGCVFYFDDVKMGMMSLSPALGSGLVHFARFTTIPVTDKKSVLLQTKSNTAH